MSRLSLATIVTVTALLCLDATCARHTIGIQRHPHKWKQVSAGEYAELVASGGSRFRAGSFAPVSGGLLQLGYYYINITVGTPPKPFNVLLDTGSANLLLPSPQCTSCGPASIYNVDESSTGHVVQFEDPECQRCNPNGGSQCFFDKPYPADVNASWCGDGISYGGGSTYAGGYLVTDVLDFAGYKVKNTFIAETNQIPAGQFQNPIAGIIGLANPAQAVNPTYAPPVFNQIVDNYGIDGVFGLCLSPTSGGALDLGFIDQDKYHGEIQYAPLTQERWYNIGVLGMNLGSNRLPLPAYVFSYLNDQIGAFVDSGTSVLLMSPGIFNTLKASFQSNYCNLPNVCGQNTIFSGTCLSQSQISGFPDVEFVIAGENNSNFTLSLPATQYFLPQGDSYCFALAAVPGIGIVMGDILMEQYYIVHDQAASRVGFAPVKSCV